MNGEDTAIKIFVFGEFQLDTESQMLSANGRQVHLPRRPFQVLAYLVAHRDRLVSRNELLDTFWPTREVYDDTLRKTIAAIRRALGDIRKPPRFIETRYGGGFRFIGQVEAVSKSAAERVEGRQNKTVIRGAIETRSRVSFLGFALAAVAVLIISAAVYLAFFPRAGESRAMTGEIPSDGRVNAIAILPLENLTGDAGNDYLSDGITESLIAEMSRMGGLRVISRSSTFALKTKALGPREIRTQLGVDAFVEGSMQKKGEELSVNIRLVSSADGSILWTSEDFHRPVSSAVELERTIACKLAIELKVGPCRSTAERNTANAEAYQTYLKGRFQWNKRTPDGIRRSIELYGRAIELDPQYAPAYAGLSESYVQGIWHVPFDPKEVLPKAESAALRAVSLDDGLAEGHTALANVYELQWKWDDAGREIRRALELDPRNVRAHHVYAFYLVTLRRFEEAIPEIERAVELDPLDLVANEDNAMILFIAGRVDEAFERWEKTLDLNPNFAMTHQHKAAAYEFLGDEPRAMESYVRSFEGIARSKAEIDDFRRLTSAGGLRAYHRRELRVLLAKSDKGGSVSNVAVALYFTLLRNREDAFLHLERAFDEQSPELVLLCSDRRFEFLQSDERYWRLLRRMGLPV